VLRTWRTAGIAGAVTSIAVHHSLLATVSLDRFARIHSTFPPSSELRQEEKKARVLEKVYVTSIPTVLIWDGCCEPVQAASQRIEGSDNGDDDDDVWDTMNNVGDEYDSEANGRQKKRRHA